MKIKVPVILGPTGVGKTAVSLKLAFDFNCEIISCDSRQIYRCMNIGTAKPTPEELASVKHWMIDVVDPDEYYSAHLYARNTLEIIRNRARKGIQVILCGGTGFYYHCLKNGTGPEIENDINFRKKYEKKVQELGSESIFNELKEIDPESAGKIHPHDIRRNIRALEIFYKAGRKRSDLQQKSNPPQDIDFFTVILSLPRDDLYNRINERVGMMAEKGLWVEFQNLRRKGYGPDSPGMATVGYKELFEVESGAMAMPDALAEIRKNTRRYAKKQNTWLRHQINGTIIDLKNKSYQDIKEKVSRFLTK